MLACALLPACLCSQASSQGQVEPATALVVPGGGHGCRLGDHRASTCQGVPGGQAVWDPRSDQEPVNPKPWPPLATRGATGYGGDTVVHCRGRVTWLWLGDLGSDCVTFGYSKGVPALRTQRRTMTLLYDLTSVIIGITTNALHGTALRI